MVKMPRKLTVPAKSYEEKRYRDVAYMLEKACTNNQIAKKLRISLEDTQKLINTVIQRWADRTGEESEMLAVREAQLMGIARRCLLEFDKRQRETVTTYTICGACAGKAYIPGGEGNCNECGYGVDDCDGNCECQVCDGKGEVRTERRVKTTKADIALLTTAQKSIIESAKLRGLYMQRRDLRDDQARGRGDLHQHVHIEVGQFEDVSSDKLEAARALLDQLDQLMGDGRQAQVIEEGEE